MKKYLIFIYICLGTIVSAQFRDNVFDDDKASETQGSLQHERSVIENDKKSTDIEQTNSDKKDSSVSSRGPGNPGSVPIDGYIPVLLLAGAALIFFYQKKKKSINL